MNTTRWATLGLFAGVVLCAGCVDTPAVPEWPDENDVAAFPSSIYYLVPGDAGFFHARLTHSKGALDRMFEVFPVGYDLQPTQPVYGDSDRRLFVLAPGGQEIVVRLRDIQSIGRPSLSSDGTRVVVQALEGDAVIGIPSEDLNT